MGFEALANRLNKRLYRRKQRKMVKRWWDDGGDRRFRYSYPLNRSSFVMDLGGYRSQHKVSHGHHLTCEPMNTDYTSAWSSICTQDISSAGR